MFKIYINIPQSLITVVSRTEWSDVFRLSCNQEQNLPRDFTAYRFNQLETSTILKFEVFVTKGSTTFSNNLSASNTLYRQLINNGADRRIPVGDCRRGNRSPDVRDFAGKEIVNKLVSRTEWSDVFRLSCNQEQDLPRDFTAYRFNQLETSTILKFEVFVTKRSTTFSNNLSASNTLYRQS
ncbi:uncharacterized protein LOC135499595 [Lineus longissimus]|uniref:uncharacterized protein LOC135499595 n=1 Tax=Lineus longissimus TaxID=88925 RepID=UPI00315CCCE2